MLFLVIGAAQAVIAYASIRKIVKKSDEKYDTALTDYCLNRILIICPSCRGTFEVETLEDQMTTAWQCAACGCHFVEHPSHTEVCNGNEDSH